MAKSYLNQSGLPRGLRNNNPGNIRLTSIAWDGKVPANLNTDKSFEQFYELRYGVRALMRQLVTDLNRGLTTISLLLNKYAPTSENNTSAYISTVSSITGLGRDQAITALNKDVLIRLAKAIVYVENGSQYAGYVSASDYEDAFAISGLNLANVKLPAPKKKLI